MISSEEQGAWRPVELTPSNSTVLKCARVESFHGCVSHAHYLHLILRPDASVQVHSVKANFVKRMARHAALVAVVQVLALRLRIVLVR